MHDEQLPQYLPCVGNNDEDSLVDDQHCRVDLNDVEFKRFALLEMLRRSGTKSAGRLAGGWRDE